MLLRPPRVPQLVPLALVNNAFMRRLGTIVGTADQRSDPMHIDDMATIRQHGLSLAECLHE